MRKYLSAGVLLVSFVIISGLLALLFLSKNVLLDREKLSHYFYQDYLTDKFKLIDQVHLDENQLCREQQKPVIRFTFKFLDYRFHCENYSIFIQPKPTQDKYIAVDDIRQWLDIDKYHADIVFIRSLKDLPESSESHPKIVIALQEINERLDRDFYGIMITDFYFDITGRRFYGALYSSYDNAREERNLSYRRAVIDNIEKRFSDWRYLPNSRNLLAHD